MRGGLVAFAAAVVLASASASADTMDDCIDANAKAQAARRTGKLREAREKLIACSAAACPSLVRTDCTKRLDEVERAIPTIVFQAKDATGQDLGNVRVTMDGAQIADKLAGTAFPVEVGDHEFVFTADGYNAVTQHFILVEGQKDRREVVTMTSTTPVTTPPTVETPPPVVQPPPPPVVQPPPPQFQPQPQWVAPQTTYAPQPMPSTVAEARSSRRATAIVLCVSSVLLFGGAVTFGVLGGQQNTSIQTGGFMTGSDIANADALGTAFNVGLGVSLAAAIITGAIGVPLLLLNLGDGTPSRSALHVGPGGLGIRW